MNSLQQFLVSLLIRRQYYILSSPKNRKETFFALISDLRKSPREVISECNIFFIFRNLGIPRDTRKIHVNKNWDPKIPHTLDKVRAILLFSVAERQKPE